MSLRINAPLPSLEGATGWINNKPEPEQLKGPLLVYFWALSCHVCHKNMPKLRGWRDECTSRGLKMIAVHCPRMKIDTNIEKVKAAVGAYGITEPCAVDNKHIIKRAFDNQFWPAYFLFDEAGKLKRRAAGNNGLAMLVPLVEKMVG